MSDTILMGRDRQISEIPRARWEQHLAQVPQHSSARLSFMSEEHHQVRNFVVKELPIRSQPIELAIISISLQLSLERVRTIVNELEQQLFFLVRDEQGAVSWAYPVTTDPTPHHLTFDTGEQLYAA